MKMLLIMMQHSLIWSHDNQPVMFTGVALLSLHSQLYIRASYPETNTMMMLCFSLHLNLWLCCIHACSYCCSFHGLEHPPRPSQLAKLNRNERKKHDVHAMTVIIQWRRKHGCFGCWRTHEPLIQSISAILRQWRRNHGCAGRWRTPTTISELRY